MLKRFLRAASTQGPRATTVIEVDAQITRYDARFQPGGGYMIDLDHIVA
ncbi:MAG: hypothetical protein ACREIA_23140 [Opitutaceae bacterium]